MVVQALRDKPAGTMPLVLGDMNADLDAPRSRGEEVLAQDMADHGLECASRHFRVRRGRHLRGRWTWRQARANATRLGERRWVRSRPDYILIPAAERKRVKSWRRIFPPHHRSDHRAMVMCVWGRRGVKRYVRKRETLPLQPPAAGERS